MNNAIITVEGTLQPDGQTLQLDQKISLPPGRVTLTVCQPVSRPGPTMLEVLDRIHQEQRQRGWRPMTDEEMADEVAAVRAEDAEYEARCRQIWSQTTSPPAPESP